MDRSANRNRRFIAGIGGLIAGAAFGAAGMYYLDPRLGHRRRVMSRDQALAIFHRAQRHGRRGALNVAHHFKGILHEAFGIFGPGKNGDARQVEARVRTELGRAVEHPQDVRVRYRRGEIILTGNLSRRELQRTLGRLKWVKGVHHIKNQIRPH